MSLYPENPAGQTFISQDTYASKGIALSGLGGGGGGQVPTNLQVSSLTVNGTGSGLPPDGFLILGTNTDESPQSAGLLFNNANQETPDEGQLMLQKGPFLSLGLVSTLNSLNLTALSTGFAQYQSLGVKSIVLGGDNNDGNTPGAEIDYSNSTSTISMYAPNVAPSGNMTFASQSSTLSQAITFDNPSNSYSLQIQPITLNYNGAVKSTFGLTVKGLSASDDTVFLPDIALFNPGGAVAASIHSANDVVNIEPSLGVSSIVGLSSINDTAFFAPRSGIFFMPPGSTTGYYDIPNPPAGITSNAVVMCTLTRPDGISQNWIVNSGVVQGGGAGTNWYIEVVMASSVVDDNTAVAWDLIAPTCTPGVAGTVPT
jgi:hypothetical protein